MLFSTEYILIHRKKYDLGLTQFMPMYPVGFTLFALHLFRLSSKISRENSGESFFAFYFADI